MLENIEDFVISLFELNFLFYFLKLENEFEFYQNLEN